MRTDRIFNDSSRWQRDSHLPLLPFGCEDETFNQPEARYARYKAVFHDDDHYDIHDTTAHGEELESSSTLLPWREEDARVPRGCLCYSDGRNFRHVYHMRGRVYGIGGCCYIVTGSDAAEIIEYVSGYRIVFEHLDAASYAERFGVEQSFLYGRYPEREVERLEPIHSRGWKSTAYMRRDWMLRIARLRAKTRRNAMAGRNVSFPKPCHVYFARLDGDDSHVKIGLSSNVKARLENLSTSSPSPLRLWFSVPCVSQTDAAELERRLHGVFADSRVHREWFVVTSKMKEFVQNSWPGLAINE